MKKLRQTKPTKNVIVVVSPEWGGKWGVYLTNRRGEIRLRSRAKRIFEVEGKQ